MSGLSSSNVEGGGSFRRQKLRTQPHRSMATSLALVAANDDPAKRGYGRSEDAADEGVRRSVEDCRKDFEDYASVKADEIDEQRKGWRYYHGQQATETQLAAL